MQRALQGCLHTLHDGQIMQRCGLYSWLLIKENVKKIFKLLYLNTPQFQFTQFQNNPCSTVFSCFFFFFLGCTVISPVMRLFCSSSTSLSRNILLFFLTMICFKMIFFVPSLWQGGCFSFFRFISYPEQAVYKHIGCFIILRLLACG